MSEGYPAKLTVGNRRLPVTQNDFAGQSSTAQTPSRQVLIPRPKEKRNRRQLPRKRAALRPPCPQVQKFLDSGAGLWAPQPLAPVLWDSAQWARGKFLPPARTVENNNLLCHRVRCSSDFGGDTAPSKAPST
ncbi:unnamed protein product [Calypogeia fissa]